MRLTVRLGIAASRPTLGFLRSTPAEPFAHLVTAFREGLKELGFVEGQNVTIEYRYGNNRPDRLPGLVADLLQRRVAVIVCNTTAAAAAKAATTTVPIVFVVGNDPVQMGLVASLQRSGGNLTGVTFFGGGQLGTKRMEFPARSCAEGPHHRRIVGPGLLGVQR